MNTSFFYNPVPLYRNALEPLVIQEVNRQVDRLPAKLLKFVEIEKIKAQAIAYALNRLPAMYATSERGWEFQQHKAQEKYGRKIMEVVRQGLAAIQLDPLIPVWNMFAPENACVISLPEAPENRPVSL
ncbi:MULTISPECIES: late competence development ComFB family protein [Planktothricoides]|uniref:Late competence development ComFB family protein n=2 Tax=Planktothricoides raciborskii TaxID=132608 RepID=A0AAU8JGT1_9CYAN|nr:MULTISPECIES: late competence development ComFB family protein [Planktothricoides]MBD2544252.1 late competence development ComFB family protein [Planktothricoides raciborskii FACHB-1370]MBD2583604.1 late competence development ComFB family protein [Planktothricoides raciborskii FACHB-1261]